MAATSFDVSMDTDDDGKRGTPSNDDAKKDIKKRKFGLFGPLKRLVRGSKKARSAKADVNVGSYKTKDVSSIQAGNSEDEDDGGFKSRLLTESRSISEGSVFKPESKDPNIEAIKKGAASVDDINNSLQSELSNRLRMRRTYSSDEEDGLPHSSVETVITADVVLKPSCVTGTSASEDSLISVDGLDLDRDQLFQSGWQSSVAGVKSQQAEFDKEGKENMDSVNFDDIPVESSRNLHNQAAKDKINIRQQNKRKPSFRERRKARIKTLNGTPPLPQVSEESPEEQPKQQAKHKEDAKVKVNDVAVEDTAILQITKDDSRPSHIALIDIKHHRESISKKCMHVPSQPVSMPARTHSPDSPMDESTSVQLSSSPISQSMLRDVKLRPRPSSMRDENTLEMDEGHDSEFSITFEKMKRFSLLKDEPTDSKPIVECKKEVPKDEISVDKAKPQSVSEAKESHVRSHNIGSHMKFVLMKEPLKSAASGLRIANSKMTEIENNDTLETRALETSKIGIESTKHGLHHVEGNVTSAETKKDILKAYTEISNTKVDISGGKSSTINVEISDRKTENKMTKNIDKLREKSDEVNTPSNNRLIQKPMVQKEEYKLRREHRSKTLPAQPLSRDVLEKKTQEDVPGSLKESKPREPLSHRLNESKPWEDSSPIFKDSKPRENFSDRLKESKPQEDLSQSLKENKPLEFLSDDLKRKEIKPKEELSHRFKDGKPREDLSQSLKERQPPEESSQSKPQELLSQNLKDRKTEKELDSPGRNVSKALSKRVEPKRLSWMGSGTSSEPVWVMRAKMKAAAEEESAKDIKNNVNNMESKSKVTSVTTDTPTTPLSTAFASREKFGGSSTEKTNIGLVKQIGDRTANKNKSQDKSSSEMSQTSSAKKNVFESKTSLIDKGKETEKVPVWKANLAKTKRDQQKDGSSVKIEIIEKSKPEVNVTEKKEEKPISIVLREKTVGKSQDISSHKSSKVSEIAKNFQTNLVS